jgi:hypothetical protein
MPGTAVVSRFELYPAENPSGYCVGFSVKNLYCDTVVELNKDETDPMYYVNKARDVLKNRLEEMIEKANSPVGTEITIE